MIFGLKGLRRGFIFLSFLVVGALFVLVAYDPYIALQVRAEIDSDRDFLINENRRSLATFSHQLLSPEAIEASHYVDVLRSNYGAKLGVAPRVEFDPNRPSCQRLVGNGGRVLLESSQLQSLEYDECPYKIQDYSISRSNTDFAVLLSRWSEEGEMTLVVGSVDAKGISVSSRSKGYPDTFIVDDDGNTLVRRSKFHDANCAIEKYTKSTKTCLVLRRELQGGESTDIVLMRRGLQNNTTWLLLDLVRDENQQQLVELKSDSSVSTARKVSVPKVVTFKENENGIYIEYAKRSKNISENLSEIAFVDIDRQTLKPLFIAPRDSLSWALSKNSGWILLKSEFVPAEFSFYRLGKGEVVRIHDDIDRKKFINAFIWGDNLLLKTSVSESAIGVFDEEGQFKTKLKLEFPFEIDFEQFEGISSDGVQIVCSKIGRQSTPQKGTVLLVYGSYGKNLTLPYNGMTAALLNEGVSFLLAHTRGGGERGKAWHVAGAGQFKKRVIDDARACLTAAISKNFARPGYIVIAGQSAGAIPAVNLALDQPELVNAVWVDAPFLDSANWFSNTAYDDLEFGPLGLHEDRNRMSPYRRLLDTDTTPGNFLLTCGEEDRNTPIFHCTKSIMAMRERHSLKAAYMYTSIGVGHREGPVWGKSEIQKKSIVINFILSQLEH